MECEEVRSWLERYLDDDLPPSTQQEVAGHLDHCYLCAEEFAELSTLLETCRDALRFPNPRNRFDALRPGLQTQRAPRWPARRHTVRYALASLAAAAVIVLFASIAVPLCRTASNLAWLAERATDPNFAETPEAQRIEAAAESNKRPLLTLVARSCQIRREDPLASLDRPQQEWGTGAAEATPDPLSKPLSMEFHQIPRIRSV